MLVCLFFCYANAYFFQCCLIECYLTYFFNYFSIFFSRIQLLIHCRSGRLRYRLTRFFFQLLYIFKKLGQIQYQLSSYYKKVLFLMRKIEWNEFWPKVVECYFKKLLLDNLFYKHLSSIHVGNIFFYFLIVYFNMFFSSIFFFNCFI